MSTTLFITGLLVGGVGSYIYIQKENNQLKKDLGRLNQEKNENRREFENQIKELKHTISSRKDESKTIQKNYENFEDNVYELEFKIKSLQSENEKLKKEVESLSATNKDYEVYKISKNLEIQQLKDKLKKQE